MGLYVHCELPSKLGPVNDVEVFREREHRRCSLKIDLFFFQIFPLHELETKQILVCSVILKECKCKRIKK